MAVTARSLTFHQSYEPVSNETTTRLEVRKLLRRRWLSSYREQSLGALLAVCGVVWFAEDATRSSPSPVSGLVTPLQVCAVGMIAWLHAKWRRSVSLDR